MFANQNGQWCRKVDTVPYYFGSWKDDLKGERALAEWVQRKDGILAGLDNLRLTGTAKGLTLLELGKRYMDARRIDLAAGRLADETFEDYRTELTGFVNHVGGAASVAKLSPEVFAVYAKHLIEKRKLGVHAQKRVMACVKAMFNYGTGEGWIAQVNFGNAFKAPDTSPEAIAQAKERAGEDGEEPIFTEEQINALLAKAKPAMKAMILLALNCGLGPSDLARLKWKHIDFTTGRLSNTRGKSGIKREAYLWKRTRDAVLLIPRQEDDLVFHTRYGTPVVNKTRVYAEVDGVRVVVKVKTTNAIADPFKQLLTEAEVKDLTFYNLRHTYRTHADNHKDRNAVLRTMGHALSGMDRRYVRKPFKMIRLKGVAKVSFRNTFPDEVKARRQMKQAGVVVAGHTALQVGMRLAQ